MEVFIDNITLEAVSVDPWGYGAWAYGFLEVKNPWMGGHDDRLGTCILALKREYMYNGHDPKAEKWSYNNLYGDQFAPLIAQFQRDNGLLPPTYTPGVIGPTVAGVLLRKRLVEQQNLYRIPDNWLAKMVSLESNNDPCALGWIDHRDRGLLQISSFYHSEVTDAQAFDPAFAIPWGARNLSNAYYTSYHDWEVAVASHNVGSYGANQWLLAGKPKTGGIDAFPALFERATFYVSLVRKAPV